MFGNNCHLMIMGGQAATNVWNILQPNSFIYNQIFIKLAGYKDNHKIDCGQIGIFVIEDFKGLFPHIGMAAILAM